VNLLLDTHLLLWSAFAAERIAPATAKRLLDPANVLWFSAASIWEVAIKRALDRPDFRVDPGVLRAGLLSNGYQELPVEGGIAWALPICRRCIATRSTGCWSCRPRPRA
jgi:PIN domain nuclease of toxin-antitoxin system